MRQGDLQSGLWSFGRVVATSSAIAAATGAVAGAVTLGSDFEPAARLFLGGLGGTVLGAVIGALSSTPALLLARLSGTLGLQAVSAQRAVFIGFGTLIALALSVSAVGPLSNAQRATYVTVLGLVCARSGLWIARRAIRDRAPGT